MPKKIASQTTPSSARSKPIRLILVLTLIFGSLPTIFTQSGNRREAIINQLLDYPAPPPPMLKEVEEILAARNIEAKKAITAPNQEPGADATAAEIIRYCRRQLQQQTNNQLSEKIRWQLLEACLQDEDLSYGVLDLLPNTSAAHNRIKQHLEKLESTASEPHDSFEAARTARLKSNRESLRRWLMRHSNYFREELIEAACAVKAEGYQLKNETSLEALARQDWQTAKPIVEGYLNQPDFFVQSFALKLLYLHSIETPNTTQTDILRRQLLEMTTNLQVSEYARRMAYDALTRRVWPGREEWFSSLLEQPNLLSSPPVLRRSGADSLQRENAQPRLPALLDRDTVSTPIRNAPDEWNALLAQFVTSSNPIVRDNAVLILATVALRKPNRDALLPLLPWFFDLNWAKADGGSNRHSVIEAAGKLKLPEAVPGLLAIIQNEKEYVRIKAVDALALYRDAQTMALAAPVLRAAISQEPIDYSISQIASLLAANGGLADSEILSALEAVATESKAKLDMESLLSISEREWMPHFLGDEILSRAGLIGAALVQQYRYGRLDLNNSKETVFTESVAAGLLARIKALHGEKPDVAARLWLVARALDFPSVDAAMAERILEGNADLETMLMALKSHQQLALRAGTTLQPMLRQDGYASGVAAILLSDANKARSIMESKDREAQIALLACARLVRKPLPVEWVGKLLAEKQNLLALAAERYLESEDSPAARHLILAQHPNEALILGGTPEFHSKRNKNEWEEPLREDVKSGKSEEIFGVYEVYYSDAGGPDRKSLEIHVVKELATICRRKDAARKECRLLLKEELEALRSLFDEINFDELSPLSVPGSGYGGTVQTFVRLTQNGGRRVVAANLHHLHSDYGYALRTVTPHDKVSLLFDKLKNTGDYEVRYALKEKIKELEVILADDKCLVSNVCGQGQEIRVLVKDEQAKYSDPAKWLTITAGKIGEETEQPAGCPIVDTRADLPESARRGFGYQPPLWQTQTKDGIVRNLYWNDQWGLWLCRVGSDPKLITQERGDPLLVTPDGRWLIITRRGREQNDLLRIDLKTGQATKIEALGWVHPIVPEPLSGRVVIPTFRREKENDQPIYEVKLYTPSSGKIEAAKGEFEPLKHQHNRALQPIAGNATAFWAAIPDEKEKKTRVGSYDARTFKFTSHLELPEITFNSTQMWLDEVARQLYVAYNGHLLRIPFPPQNTIKQ